MRQIVLLGNQEGKDYCLLDAKTSHYLIDVRRMRKGDSFAALDEAGFRYRCTIVDDNPRATRLSLVMIANSTVDTSTTASSQEIHINQIVPPTQDLPNVEAYAALAAPAPPTTLHVALVQAVPKAPAFDRIIRHAVELEVELIVPVVTEHCVGIAPPHRVQSKLERRQRIIREALQQSGSLVQTKILPTIALAQLDDVLKAQGFDTKEALRILFMKQHEAIPSHCISCFLHIQVGLSSQ